MLRVTTFAVCCLLLTACGGDDKRPIRIVAPRAVDPGGSEQSRVRLGSGGKLLGINGQTWLFTGSPQPVLDQGVTADSQLADLRVLGVNALRVVISWYDVEPRPGSYTTAYVDRVKALTDRFERAGGRVLLVLAVPPSWARAAKRHPSSTIVDSDKVVERYAAFAGFVARTWPRAAGIETWNEPNTTYFWRPRRPEPELFTRMHKAAAAAIRATGTSAKVILGSTLGTPEGAKNVVRSQRWLKSLYAEGLEPSDYDAIGFHPYPVPVDGTVPRLDGGEFGRTFDDFRLGYREADPGARVWLTETGYTTTGSWAIPEATRAVALPALVRKLASLPEVDALFLYELYDATHWPPQNILAGFGLAKARGAAPAEVTPTFCSIRRLSAGAAPDDRC
jgi:hypothetical protein